MTSKRALKPVAQLCEWFALCTNEATKTRPHPIIGPVPICDRCDEKTERIGASTVRPL